MIMHWWPIFLQWGPVHHFLLLLYISLFFSQKKNYMRLITVSLIPRELEGDTNIATAGFFVPSPNQNGSNDKMISFLIISAVQLFDQYLYVHVAPIRLTRILTILLSGISSRITSFQRIGCSLIWRHTRHTRSRPHSSMGFRCWNISNKHFFHCSLLFLFWEETRPA